MKHTEKSHSMAMKLTYPMALRPVEGFALLHHRTPVLSVHGYETPDHFCNYVTDNTDVMSLF